MIRSRVLVGLFAATFALAACGGGGDDISDLSANKILAKTKAAVKDAKSMSVSGKGGEGRNSLDVDLQFTDTTGEGSITTNGTEIELLGVDGKTYFRADPEVYASFAGAGGDTQQVIDAIGDKWIAVDPKDENFSDFESFASLDGFVDQALDPDSKLTKTKEKKVDGVDCIGLKSSTGTLYVDKSDGRPISLQSGDGGGNLSFDYDKVDAPDAPSSGEVFDLNSLQR